MELLDLLVISSACHTAVNRKIYRLFKEDGWKVAIVIPSQTRFLTGNKQPEPALPEDPELIKLTVLGSNPRIQIYRGLISILNKRRPKYILLDLDPLSVTASRVGLWSKKNKSNFFCLTCENLPISLADTFRRRGVTSIPGSLLKKSFLIINKFLVDGVFTINHEGTSIFKNLGFKRIIKIPLGFDPRLFKIDSHVRNEIRNRLQLESKTIAFFGRFTYEKGVHVLIEALAALKDFDWNFVMDEFVDYKTPYAEQILEMLKHNELLDRVKFVDPKHSEMGNYMNAVDIVVVPSISTKIWVEQYGRIAAEAMACGKLVIASDTGALPMLVGKYGILFSEGNYVNLKKILAGFLSGEKVHMNSTDIERYAHEMLSVQKQKEIMKASFDQVSELHRRVCLYINR